MTLTLNVQVRAPDFPNIDTENHIVGGRERHYIGIDTAIETAKYRHAGQLEFNWLGRWKEAMLENAGGGLARFQMLQGLTSLRDLVLYFVE